MIYRPTAAWGHIQAALIDLQQAMADLQTRAALQARADDHELQEAYGRLVVAARELETAASILGTRREAN